MKTTEALGEPHSELVVEENCARHLVEQLRRAGLHSGLGVSGEGLCLGV